VFKKSDILTLKMQNSQDISDGTVTDWMTGVQFLAQTRDISTLLHPDRLWDTSRLVSNGYWEAKQLGHEADHSPPSSVKVKNGGAIP
jgi:hypothetical protein